MSKVQAEQRQGVDWSNEGLGEGLGFGETLVFSFVSKKDNKLPFLSGTEGGAAFAVFFFLEVTFAFSLGGLYFPWSGDFSHCTGIADFLGLLKPRSGMER